MGLGFKILLMVLIGFCVIHASEEKLKFSEESLVFFENKIRPLLAEHCYDCHSDHKHENGLRLDHRQFILKGSDYQQVIDLKDGMKSKLLKAVRHEVGVEAMPKKAKKLTDQQIKDLETWVMQQLPWPEEQIKAGEYQVDPKQHWAFQPIVRPNLLGLEKNPIDDIIKEQMQVSGLSLRSSVEPATLLKRMYYTMTGLAPNFDELSLFEKEYAINPEATVRKKVDKLSKSQIYGEHWARHWMDVVRYADTDGFQPDGFGNLYPFAYSYRNWLVDAFVNDMPYDQFISHQLAADLILGMNEEKLAAYSQVEIPDKVTPENNDRSELKNLAALGMLAVGDRFFGNNQLTIDDQIDVITRGTLGVTVACARCHNHKFDPIQSKDYYSLYSILNSSDLEEENPILLKSQNIKLYSEYFQEFLKLEKKKKSIEAEVREDYEKVEKFTPILILVFEQLHTENISQLRGNASLKKVRDSIAMVWHAAFFKVKSQKKELMFVEQVIKGMPQDWGQVMPTEQWLELLNQKQNDFPAEEMLLSRWKSLNNPTRRQAALVLAKLILNDGSKLGEEVSSFWHQFITDPKSSFQLQKKDIFPYLTRADRERVNSVRREIQKLDMSHPAAPVKTMVMIDKSKPIDGKVFLRGDIKRPGGDAPRGWLSFFGGEKFQQGSGRLELAKKIVARDNPLTARVWVNRVWAYHFGAPLVSSMSDFGVQCAKPKQQKLLDFLASYLMENGWRLSALHELILTSKAYQQPNLKEAVAEKIDPTNDLLSWYPRQRKSYESMRDTMLKVSGELQLNKGWNTPVSVGNPTSRLRRTLYLFWSRTAPENEMLDFDVPVPDSHVPNRTNSLVPQQTLYLMNSQFVYERSSNLLKELEKKMKLEEVEHNIEDIYKKILLRLPSVHERERIRQYINLQTKDKSMAVDEIWRSVIQVLLICNETQFID